MSQKKFYDNNAKKFLIHKTKFNHTDSVWQDFIDNTIWNHIWKTILDYWCWGWEISLHHLNKWASLIFWVDISKELLNVALKRTSWFKNIEFMSIDDENYYFDKLVWNNFFDFIVSYYVFCTIDDYNLIKSIANSFHKKLKTWWKALLLMPNRDKFNGKTCYGFSFIRKESLKDWDVTTTYLRTNKTKLPTKIKQSSSHLKINDFFRSQSKLEWAFEEVWFKVEIHEIFVKDWQYNWIVDEKKHSPMYILEAIKN